MERKRVPSLIAYLTYEEGKQIASQGTKTLMLYLLLYLTNSPLGCLQADKNNLAERYYPGCFRYMVPRVEHWMDEVTRTEDRQAEVFTISARGRSIANFKTVDIYL